MIKNLRYCYHKFFFWRHSFSEVSVLFPNKWSYFLENIIKLQRSHVIKLQKSVFEMLQVSIMCIELSLVKSFYIDWMHPVVSVDSIQFVHQIEHEQLLNFFLFAFFPTKSLYFPICWHHFNADKLFKMVKVTKNQLQLITRLNFRS